MSVRMQHNSPPLPLDFGQKLAAKTAGVVASGAIAKDARNRADQSRQALLRDGPGREPWSLQPPDCPQHQTFGQDTVADLDHEYRLAIRGRRMVLRKLMQVGKLHGIIRRFFKPAGPCLAAVSAAPSARASGLAR